MPGPLGVVALGENQQRRMQDAAPGDRTQNLGSQATCLTTMPSAPNTQKTEQSIERDNIVFDQALDEETEKYYGGNLTTQSYPSDTGQGLCPFMHSQTFIPDLVWT
ncbi:hypothetical protein VNO77_19855 [Canavalia gladiata]|uniref:Uncharacterized protein n=1 Tax=Canavalia gladiata TaxID=3824 RepID=A0AAN9QLU9_CANGL